MLHTLLASALLSVSAQVATVATPVLSPRATLDTAMAAPVAKRLTLDLRAGGSVRIVGAQDKVVRIRVTENGRACGDCGVQLEQGSDGIQVHSSRPATSGTELRFEIEVPEHFDLDLS